MMAKKSPQTADVHQYRPSQSGIPVFTPRRPQSSVPSTLSTPQLGLVPPTRHLSVSGSPQHPSPSSSSSSTSGGITPFRSFRNLFSTASGSSKHSPTSASSTVPVSSPKSSFPATALGSLRRSIGGDHSVSAPNLRHDQELSYEDTPVLQIDLPRPDFQSFVHSASLFQGESSSSAGPSRPSPFPGHGRTPSMSHLQTPSIGFGEHRQTMQQDRSPSRTRRDALVKDVRPPLPATEPSFVRSASQDGIKKSGSSSTSQQAQRSDGFTPSPSPSPVINPTDLSTIIEAENSGLSKHLPPLDTSQEVDTSLDDNDVIDPDLEHDTLDPKLLHVSSRNKLARTPPSKESSVLDLSTSKVTSEVLQAMGGTGPDRTQGWLNGIVVDDHDPEPGRDSLAESGVTGDGDASFNLSELDPDLAALLSPNRLVSSGTVPPSQSAADNLLPPPSPTKESSVSASPSESPRRPAFSRTPPRSSPPREPEPLRMPKSRTAPNLPSTVSANPRLNRSVSDRPAIQRLQSDSPPLAVPSTARAMSHSPERPSIVTEGRQRDSLDHYSSRRPHTGTGPGESSMSAPRGSAISRLLSPARLGPHVASPRNPSRPPSRSSPRVTQDAPPSPGFSRPSSAAGLPSSRSQPAARSSLDVRPGPDESMQAATPLRYRKRSLSVVEGGQSTLARREYPRAHAMRPTTEWIGPQTAKAFAAAGLLDQSYVRDRDSMSLGRRTPSRFSTTRSSIDDSRSRYVPSRMAFSEAGSINSWPRGETPSISRRGSIVRTPTLTATVSELGGLETPRTTLSAASTAPTSVSASSHLQSEYQSLQERHQVETGALLSALADSQRTAKVLREENTQLRDRLAEVEFKLVEAMEEIQRLQHAPPPSAPHSSRVGHPRYASVAAERPNRVGSRSPRKQSFLRESESPEDSPPHSSLEHSRTVLPANRPELGPYLDSRRFDNRMSTSSSLLPGPPSNMSMLMHEEALSAAGSPSGDHSVGFSSRPPSPASPTLVLAKLSNGPITISRDEKMGPEPGNISPTTADFSMVTSSPGSLNLRPEHELHLEDMPSFDLNPEREDDGLYETGHL
ncbi:hypothetical protein DAEQUDRAFT_813747 [Daedalea quercina L-15889]|uniref:Uncharacterized protein n=1 Tax=Daedalea quercina L-15889 TaxID=1314783 RepID=A0A165MWJ1_9APHY|nr:hypothetical protein DAEQUDRAFT_813747 [Daedalea quercina L-15889]